MHITNSTDAYNVVLPHIDRYDQEECFIATLNVRNEVTDISLMAIGTDTECYIPIKHIAKKAILNNAKGVILYHTHPSGDSAPSKADITQTEQLKSALSLFSISLLDHIVIGKDEYFSFSDDNKTNNK